MLILFSPLLRSVNGFDFAAKANSTINTPPTPIWSRVSQCSPGLERGDFLADLVGRSWPVPVAWAPGMCSLQARVALNAVPATIVALKSVVEAKPFSM